MVTRKSFQVSITSTDPSVALNFTRWLGNKGPVHRWGLGKLISFHSLKFLKQALSGGLKDGNGLYPLCQSLGDNYCTANSHRY